MEKINKENNMKKYLTCLLKFFKKELLKPFLIVMIINIIFSISYTSMYVPRVEQSIKAEQGKTVEENDVTKNNEVKKVDLIKYIAEQAISAVIIIIGGFLPYIYIGVLGVLIFSTNTATTILRNDILSSI